MCAQTTATAWIEKNPKDDSSLMLHPMPTYEVPSTEDNTQHHVNLFKSLHHIHIFKKSLFSLQTIQILAINTSWYFPTR